MAVGNDTLGNLKGMTSELKQIVDYLKETKGLVSDIKKASKGISLGGVGAGTPGGGFGNGGTGNSGNSVMPGMGGVASANGSAGLSMGGMRGAIGQTALGLAKFGTALATTGFNALPNTTQVIGNATKYYNAALGQGVSRRLMTDATFSAMRGGLTGIGSDAATAQQLAGMGIGFSTDKSSQYMRTLTGVSNAAKYLNMENPSSAAAIGGLKSGSMSANLMRNFGIKTSDWNTGKTLTQGQIFEQLAQRMQTGKQLTKENIMDSYQRGFLGQNLKNSGLSEDQQGMFVQYLLAKAEGKNMDLEDPNAMADLMKGKDLNPAQAGYDINTSESKLQNKVADSYISGQQKAVGLIQEFNNVLEKTPPLLLELKSGFDTLLGSNGTANVVKGLGDALTGLTETVLGLIGMLAAGGLLNGTGIPLGGKGGKGGKGGGSPAGGKGNKGGKGGKASPKAGPKVGAGAKIGGGAAIGAVMGGVQLASDISAGNTDAGTMGGDIGSTVGGILGGVAGMLIPVPGLDIAASVALSTAGSWAGGQVGQWLGQTLFGGGAANTTAGAGTRTNSAPNKSLKFMWPVKGQFTDGFGPRGAVAGQSGFHNGQDIAAPEGTPIGASEAGTVIEVSSQDLGGKYVKIKHSNGYVTGYFHQSAQKTSVGKEVKQGETIGLVGSTGAATGPHVHFTVQDTSGAFIDPRSVVNGTVTVSPSGTQDSAEKQKSGVDVVIGSASSISSDSLVDQRAKRKAGAIQGLRMGGGAAVNVLTNKPSAVLGTSRSSKSSKGMGSYDNNAPRAKDGDPYVAQDGPVNVHAGEAILTAEQAAIWRNEQRGFGGRNKGTNVTINLTVASASEAEARRFAKIVQSYLEEDGMVGRMGRN